MHLRRIVRVLVCVSVGISLQLAIQPPTVNADGSSLDVNAYPLLFHRESKTEDADSLIQIVMVGDTSLARGVAKVVALHNNNMDYPFEDVTAVLTSADIAVGNYEGVIVGSGEGQSRGVGYELTTTPDAAPALARAGFDILNLANNHAVDMGVDGLQATYGYLHDAGMQTIGAGADREGRAPLVITVHGVRIAWMAFTTVPDPPGPPDRFSDGWARSWIDPAKGPAALVEQIKAARSISDVVIVQFHWGNEYANCPRDWQMSMGRAAIEAGASLVVGHHPHVVQGVERYGQGFIAYSLGNFVFDQPHKPGLALWIRVDKQGVIDVHGLTLSPGERPVWNSPRQALSDVMNMCRPHEAP